MPWLDVYFGQWQLIYPLLVENEELRHHRVSAEIGDIEPRRLSFGNADAGKIQFPLGCGGGVVRPTHRPHRRDCDQRRQNCDCQYSAFTVHCSPIKLMIEL